MDLKCVKVSFPAMAAAGLSLWMASAAHAVSPAPATWPTGDAVRGKVIYNDNCSGCHLDVSGGLNQGIQNIARGRGAAGPSIINTALLTRPQMMVLEPTLTAQNIADISAYLTNPSLGGIPVSSGTASPNNLNFPLTEVGSSSSATVTFTAAVGPVTLSALSVSPSIYTITGGTCAVNLVVPAGGSCTVVLSFRPTLSGTNAAGNLTFDHNAATSTQTGVSLAGAGSASPVAQVSPASVSFAATAVGASSPVQVVTLSNSGNAALSLGAVAVSSPAFRITGGTCANGLSLAVSASCTVHVSLAPTASGAATANLTLRHNGGVTGAELTSSVPLSGLAVANAPAVVLSPSTLSLSQMVGTTSAPQTVVVSNQGTAAVSLSSVAAQGPNAGEFARSGGTCSTSLAAGASCTLTVAFTPAATGSRTATLSVAHSATGTPSTVALNGQGTGGAMAALALNSNQLSFASQALSNTSAAQIVTVTNSGTAALNLSALSLAGPNAADFTLSGGSCAVNTPVLAGASCTVLVSSRPATVGAKSAHLSFTSNAVNGAVSLPLAGRGVATAVPLAVLSVSSVDFGNATVGAPAVVRVVRLTNTGGAALALGNVAVAGAGVGQTHTCGTSLAAGASCNVTLTYAPTSAVALVGGRLTLASNAAGSPLSIALVGTGVTAASPVLSWATVPDGVFADTAAGAVAATKTFTLNNAGPGAATVSAVQASGAQQGEFVLGGTCLTTSTVAALSSCTVTVAFAPSRMGLRSAQLQVVSPGVAPAPVALTGRGVVLAQNGVSPSATTLSFPATATGATEVLPVTFTNTGTTSAALNSVTIANAMFTSQWSRQPQCVSVPLLLEPGQSCAMEVSFKPTTTAAQADGLDLNTNLSAATRVELRAAGSGTEGPGTGGGGGSGAASGSGGGGCSLVSTEAGQGGRADPTLWLLCLAALGVLWHRARRRVDY
ncbi:MAG: choice-of-anchor D domain-containing protein [Pseudomonadota bacterium]